MFATAWPQISLVLTFGSPESGDVMLSSARDVVCPKVATAPRDPTSRIHGLASMAMTNGRTAAEAVIRMGRVAHFQDDESWTGYWRNLGPKKAPKVSNNLVFRKRSFYGTDSGSESEESRRVQRHITAESAVQNKGQSKPGE